MKLDFDTESNILEWISELERSNCAIISDAEGSENYLETAEVLETLLEGSLHKRWEDNSSSQLPPDYVNEQDGLMMEIMRFDDHSPNGKKNPNLAKQRKMAEELQPLMAMFPNVKHVFINAVTDLPTEEDHNYRFYCNAFKRTVAKHSTKIASYRKNHPGKKLIFLAVDESSGIYIERASNTGELPFGRPHFPFCDKRLIDCFDAIDIDYFILFCPFNHYESIGGHIELPKLVIFDIKNMDSGDLIQRIEYDEKRMFSSEQ